MLLSVFEKVLIPKNSSDKKALAKYSSKPYAPLKMSSNSTEELIDIVTNRGWSPFIFSDYRSQKSFLSTNFAVLDIDDGLTIENALERVTRANLYCVCLPTSSHTKELHKYRLIFVLDRKIENVEVFKYNMNKLIEIFPESDSSCVTDNARFYFPCKFSDEGFIYNGDLLEVKYPEIKNEFDINKIKSNSIIRVDEDIKDQISQLYGKVKTHVPECISYFIKNANTGISGNWIVSLNSFVFTLALQNLEYNDIYNIIESLAPNELDSRDEDCIDRAYNDGLKAREEMESLNYV